MSKPVTERLTGTIVIYVDSVNRECKPALVMKDVRKNEDDELELYVFGYHQHYHWRAKFSYHGEPGTWIHRHMVEGLARGPELQVPKRVHFAADIAFPRFPRTEQLLLDQRTTALTTLKNHVNDPNWLAERLVWIAKGRQVNHRQAKW